MARSVKVVLGVDVSQYVSGLQRAGAVTSEFTGKMDRAAKEGKLGAVSDQATKLGIAGVAAFGLVVKSAADFDKQMSAVKAATHASSAEIDQLREAALQAGKSSQFSATEAADGITQLAKAGVSTADVLGGGLKGALDLAAAGQIGVSEAAETAASAMTQFKLKGDQVPHVADLLAAAAGKAQGGVHEMGAALAQSGLVAAQFGLSIEDTTGTLAAFASAGLLGSDAGTSFKTMLLALANPAEKTQKAMDAVGIAAYDAQGKFVGITGLAEQLKTKLGGLTQAQRDSTLAQIFGTDAIRAANILYTQGATGIQGWIDKTNDAGYAAETAHLQTDNLAGDIERLKGSLETLAIQAGSGANGGLRVLTQALGGMVDEFGNLPPAVGSTVTVIAGIGGVLLLSAVAWGKYRKVVADVTEQLNALGPNGEKAAGALGKVEKAAAVASVAFVALEVVGAVADAFGQAAPNVDKLTSALTNLANTGKVSGELTDAFGKNMEDFKFQAMLAEEATHGFDGALNKFTSSIPGFGSLLDTFNEKVGGASFNSATAAMAAYDDALTKAMETSGDAQKASALWSDALERSALDTDQLVTILPNAAKKVGEMNTAAMNGTSSMNGMGGAATGAAGDLKGVGTAAGMTADEIKDLNKAFDSLFGRYMSADKAAIAYRAAVADTNKELSTGTRTLKEATGAGDKHRLAVLAEIDAIKDVRTANLNNGSSIESADKKYQAQLGTLQKHLTALGYDKTAVGELINKYKAIPARVDTQVTVTNLPAVKNQLSGLLIMQAALKKGVPASAIAATNKNVAQGFAGGGWTGPGSKYEPAGIVHADEHVIQKDSRQSLEKANPGGLDYMNQTGRWPGYDGGGRVAWPFPTTAAMTRIPSKAEASAAVMPSFGAWPSSPSAQRGDSGVWRSIVALIKGTGPLSGSFGNAYRPGDPLWHGSGRAVDWMGFNQDALASFLAARRPLELIHRSNTRDYAYTRGVNKGSFNNALMQAHRNHVHIAMQHGGVIGEPVVGVGMSGRSYSFGESGPETVTPGAWSPASRGGGGGVVVNVQAGYVVTEQQLQNKITETLEMMQRAGRIG